MIYNGRTVKLEGSHEDAPRFEAVSDQPLASLEANALSSAQSACPKGADCCQAINGTGAESGDYIIEVTGDTSEPSCNRRMYATTRQLAGAVAFGLRAESSITDQTARIQAIANDQIEDATNHLRLTAQEEIAAIFGQR